MLCDNCNKPMVNGLVRGLTKDNPGNFCQCHQLTEAASKMTFAERNRKFILKLQSLPEKKKKIILWTIVAILAVIMGFFWLRGAINSFSKIGSEFKIIK